MRLLTQRYRSSWTAVLTAIGLMVAAVFVVDRTASSSRGDTPAAALQGSAAEPDPIPTEWDAEADARATAEAFAGDSNAVLDVSAIPTITEFLTLEDPYVRAMGAAAVTFIAISPDAAASSLRDAVRNDSELVAALKQSMGYFPGLVPENDSEEAREEAVRAIGWLFVGAPSTEIETALTDAYDKELSTRVRGLIVTALALHQYTSEATENVFMDAAGDYDPDLAAAAVEHLARLYELRGP